MTCLLGLPQRIRRDATVPTTVVVVTQAASNTASPASPQADSEYELTITILKTVTAGPEPGAAKSTRFSRLDLTRTSAQVALGMAALGALSVSTSALASQATLASVSLGAISLKATAANLALPTSISLLLSPSLLSSTRLGLAIGIPIAAVCIFGLVVFILIFLRKRMDAAPTDTLAFRLPKAAPARPADKQPASSVYLSHDLERGFESTYGRHRSAPTVPEPALQKPNFLKRISRLMSMPESPLEFKSPVFLRRFHLLSNKYEPEEKHEKELPEAPVMSHREPKRSHVPETVYPERRASVVRVVPELIYVVVKPYARRLGDELSVCIGEKVSIVDHHSDGWAAVRLIENGEVGVIPLMCIKKFISKSGVGI